MKKIDLKFYLFIKDYIISQAKNEKFSIDNWLKHHLEMPEIFVQIINNLELKKSANELHTLYGNFVYFSQLSNHQEKIILFIKTLHKTYKNKSNINETHMLTKEILNTILLNTNFYFLSFDSMITFTRSIGHHDGEKIRKALSKLNNYQLEKNVMDKFILHTIKRIIKLFI